MNFSWIFKKKFSSTFTSVNPTTGEKIWEGPSANLKDINNIMRTAEQGFKFWSGLTSEQRIKQLEFYQSKLKENKEKLKMVLSEELGKPLWESETEILAMINKVPISIEAMHKRYDSLMQKEPEWKSITRHKPHGILTVFGPYNFPGHLPNGHIVPALLAGNVVVFKPSELTPKFAEVWMDVFKQCNFPKGVINYVQGGADTGHLLAMHPGHQGILFTGSVKTGRSLMRALSPHSGKILALEMGGNNALVVHKIENIDAAVYHTIQSAFITSGQRCSCARRLILTEDPINHLFLNKLIQVLPTIKVGAYTDMPEPFMGPLVSEQAAAKVKDAYNALIKAGGKRLVPLTNIAGKTKAFLRPGLIDVTPILQKPDEEVFGPLLQVTWVKDFEAAITEANNTAYGLTAGLLSEDPECYSVFLNHIQAGVINWNRPITGASSKAPFGGIKQSGNHRPSAYYAADYCAYPVASLETETLKLPDRLSPGLRL